LADPVYSMYVGQELNHGPTLLLPINY
jgi:hypothetical protein